MGFSYSGDPSKSSTDTVRFLVQDTNSKDVLLQDEEIAFLVNEEGSVEQAAMRAAETIAAQFSITQCRMRFPWQEELRICCLFASQCLPSAPPSQAAQYQTSQSQTPTQIL